MPQELTPASSIPGLLMMEQNSRAFLVGETGTGKSTLMEVMLKEYLLGYSTKKIPARALIIDTKPRFRAEKELNGLSTNISRRYAKWGYGSGVLGGSYVLSRVGSIKSQLDQVWGLGGSIAIISCEREDEWEYATSVARVFYERYGASHPRILLVDELADFFKYRSMADIFQRVARNGRERGCALIAGSQRPRKIPVEVMTELKRIYMFRLEFSDDIEHIYKFGVPKDTIMPDGFSFFMYDRALRRQYPSAQYYELDLE